MNRSEPPSAGASSSARCSSLHLVATGSEAARQVVAPLRGNDELDALADGLSLLILNPAAEPRDSAGWRVPTPTDEQLKDAAEHQKMPTIESAGLPAESGENMTPKELVKQKVCSAACLSAMAPDRRCRCQRCGGHLHGILANADITALIDARRYGRDLLDDLEVIADAAA